MWRTFALNNDISQARDVYLVDLRNHGESDWHASMTYEEMAYDVKVFADQRELEKFTIIGHNIGAKTAMMTATLYPDRVNGFISLDTAPQPNPEEKLKKLTLDSLKSIKDLNVAGKTKKAALDEIKANYPDQGIVNLISNNLIYTEASDYKTVEWRVNLDALAKNFESISGYNTSHTDKYKGLAYFLNGSLSVKYDDEVYLKEFPNARIAEIEGAGHYIHQDKGQTTVNLIAQCLSEIESQKTK